MRNWACLTGGLINRCLLYAVCKNLITKACQSMYELSRGIHFIQVLNPRANTVIGFTCVNFEHRISLAEETLHFLFPFEV